MVFEERGNRSSRRKSHGAEWRTDKLNPHLTPTWESNPGHIGGRRVLSSLRHLSTPTIADKFPTIADKFPTIADKFPTIADKFVKVSGDVSNETEVLC